MTDGSERRLDRIGAQVYPVLRWKVVEGEQRRTILHQARDRLREFRLVGRDESVEGELGLIDPWIGNPNALFPLPCSRVPMSMAQCAAWEGEREP